MYPYKSHAAAEFGDEISYPINVGRLASTELVLEPA
jgi:hypothetical protein